MIKIHGKAIQGVLCNRSNVAVLVQMKLIDFTYSTVSAAQESEEKKKGCVLFKNADTGVWNASVGPSDEITSSFSSAALQRYKV